MKIIGSEIERCKCKQTGRKVLVNREFLNLESRDSKTRLLRYCFYFCLFLLGFAPFFPVPYAPEFAHDFFSGIGSIIFVPVFLGLFGTSLVLSLWRYLRRRDSTGVFVEVVLIPVVFLTLNLLFFSTLIEVRNKSTTWLNKGKRVENFVNPFLGMKFVNCQNVRRDYNTYFRHDGFFNRVSTA